MAAIGVNVEHVGEAAVSRAAPRLVLRGRRRKSVKKALQQLRVVMRQDQAEEARSDKLDYDPYLVLTAGTNGLLNAATRLVTRFEASLAAKS